MKTLIRVIYTLCVLLIISCTSATQRSLDSQMQEQGLEPQLELVVQTGHSNRVISVSFSQDGSYALTAGGDKLKLWEVSGGREIRTFGHGTSVTFSPDGRTALSGGGKTINIWDISSGEEIRSINTQSKEFSTAPFFLGLGEVSSVAFSPDGKYIFSAIKGFMTENSLMLFEVSSGKLVKTFHEGMGGVESMAISPDGKYILAGTQSTIGGEGSPISIENSLKLWEVSSGRLIQVFSGNTKLQGMINSVAFSPDGRFAVSGGYGEKIKLWDIASGSEIRSFGAHLIEVYSVAISPDGKYILSTNSEKEFNLWDISNGRLIRKFEGNSGLVMSAAFSPDGNYVLSGSYYNTPILWEASSGSLIRTFGAAPSKIGSIAFSPDGRYTLSGSNDNTLKLWDLQEGSLSRIFKGHTNLVKAVTFSPDSRYAMSGSFDNTLKLWDVSSGKLIRTFKGHTGGVTTVEYSPDGKFVISGSHDKTIKLWHISKGRLIRTIKGGSGSVYSLAFSPDGRYVLSGEGTELILWDISKGTKIWRFDKGRGVSHVAFSPNGKYALSEDSSFELIDASTGSVIQSFFSHDWEDQILQITFSPDGRNAISFSSKGMLKAWDISTGMEISTHKIENRCGEATEFSPSSKFLLSGCSDGTLRYIDVEKNELLATMAATTEGEWAVVTPNGLFDKSENFTGMHWVRGLDIIELDQFFDDFYTPGLLAQVMSGEEIERPDINITDILKQSPPPSVEIISPSVGETFSNKTVEVQIRVTDNGGGIDEIKLLHNGKRVSDDIRGMKKKASGKTVVRSYNVSLVSGQNEFIASAYSKGRIESRGYKLEVLFKGTAKSASSYILAIGINKYKNKRLNLNYARADAEAFTELIKQKSKSLFQNVNVVTLYDRDATKESVLSALDEIAAKAEPEDVFTFYYAGHGTVVDNRFYFVTSENVKLYDREKLDLNAIYVKDLQEKLSNIKSLKQLIVMDACQSGAATELLAVRGASEEKALAQLARSAGVHVFASAGSEQFATEFKELGHGVFTYVLLEALRGKADGAPKDGKVTVNELKAYIDDQVPELTEKYKGEAQYPTIASKGQDFPVGVVK